MAATVVIPARYGSTRFPAKILASETGKPLVQHVVERARLASRVREVLVATDDQRIVDALRPFETRCVMTSPNHQSGTDRIAEVARGLADEIVVNVQGDEPEIEPATIDGLVEHMESSDDDMATAATRFPSGADPADPNLVKVVIDNRGRALYFSRSPIPFRREPDSTGNAVYYLHLGIYAYRWQFLADFTKWPPSELEKTEKLEQLRALEHGFRIHVVETYFESIEVDTPEDLARVRRHVAITAQI